MSSGIVGWVESARPTVSLITSITEESTMPADATDPRLAHMVYFTLKDNSPAAIERLLAACKKYLFGHPGTLYAAAGTLCESLTREVNIRDWDVAWHIIFDSKAAHDQYQAAD